MPNAIVTGATGRVPFECQAYLSKWAQRQEVKEARNKLAKREGLDKSGIENATWGFSKFVFGRNHNLVISMSKARKAGWTGYEDTWESMEKKFERSVGEKVLPAFE
ncbi:hypothetical protein E4T42_06096 [Aureobasidium subglaciale]|nr:hypothetical protein E4T42_06096 [Aureobasidium subglaciale]